MTRTALALPLMLCPGFAVADVTPEDVWDNIKSAYEATGLSVTGTTTRAGDTLTVTEGRVVLTYPVIGGQASATLPQMGLIDQGDGTVRILTPETFLSTVTADIPDSADQITFDLAIAQGSMDSIASGDPGDVTYTTDVDNYDILVSNLVVPGEEVDVSVEVDTDGYAGVSRITVTDETVTITSDIVNRDAVTRMRMAGGGMLQESETNAGAVTTQGTIVLPRDMNIMNLTPALKSGLSLMVTAVSEASSGKTTTSIDGSPFSEQVQSTGPSRFDLSIDESGLTMTGGADSFDLTLTQPELMPFPIAMSGGAATAAFAMPLVASEAPQGFQYAFSLGDLVIDDGIWGMFDPTQGLDRSPIDFAIDITGELDWNLDVFDINRWIELEETGEVPIKPLSASLNDFVFNALGGAVTGTGAFTFDNDDMATFPGMPRPEGSLKLMATGLNAVRDQLVAVGLLPEEQAGMAMMFMGMFARETGEDTLETEVVVDETGAVFVNGQQMR